MLDTNISLGDYVTNNLTNTEGYVTAIADHLTGCTRIGFRPRSQDPSEHHDVVFVYPAELTVTSAPQTLPALTDASLPEAPRVEPGHVVEDEIMGVRGLAGVVTHKAFNCPEAYIYPETDDGFTDDGLWVDCPRLDVICDEYVGTYEDDTENDPQATGAMGQSMSDSEHMGDL